jgi:putative endonuclease
MPGRWSGGVDRNDDTTPRRRAWRRGVGAERAAALLLRLKGYRILARRYRTPMGEIDLVARRGSVVAIVEVKTRRQEAAALEAVSPRQRERLARAALYLLPRLGTPPPTIRFDVVTVVPGRWPRHVPDAWRPAALTAE